MNKPWKRRMVTAIVFVITIAIVLWLCVPFGMLFAYLASLVRPTDNLPLDTLIWTFMVVATMPRRWLSFLIGRVEP